MGGCASKPKVLKAEKLEAAMPLVEEKTVEVAGGDQKVEEVTKVEVGKEVGGGDHQKEKAIEEKVLVVEAEAGEENKPRSLGNLLKDMVTLHLPMKSFIYVRVDEINHLLFQSVLLLMLQFFYFLIYHGCLIFFMFINLF